jgi:hypothetical protein
MHLAQHGLLLLLEILVGERQLGLACLSTSSVNFEGALPLGWKCPFIGAGSSARAVPLTGEHVTRHGERRKGTHELASGTHGRLLI